MMGAFYTEPDDKELFMGLDVGSTSIVKPNVVVLMDSSGSMNNDIFYPQYGVDGLANTPDDGFDPRIKYTGTVDSAPTSIDQTAWYARWIIDGNARQRSQWEKFFLYLDIEALLLNNSDWRIRYEKLSEEGRLELIEDYKTGLKAELVDQDILVIPDDFEIETTTYTAFEGQITVLEKFDYRDYTELKLYTYYVERKNTFWMITNYEVLNLGTE